MAEFVNTAPQQDPLAFWKQNNPAAFANQGAKPGDPGTYQGDDGTWYEASGRQIFVNTAAPYTPAPFGGTAAPTPTPAPQTGGGLDVAGGGTPQTVGAFSGVQYPEFSPPPLPDSLKNPFTLPTADNLYASDPGIQARFNFGEQALERGAAAQGSLLNGGTRKAELRYGQDYASNEYKNFVDQKLGERQQQSSDYLNLAYGPAWMQNSAAVGQYNNLYGQYQDLIGNNRNAYNDYTNNLYRLFQGGAGAAAAGNPSPGTTGSNL